MRKLLLLLPIALLVAVLGPGAGAQRGSSYDGFLDSPEQTRAALRDALNERARAEQRSTRLEREANAARDAASRAAREAAALAARIQQAEAGIAAAEARIALIDRERERLREVLGAEQQPVVRLTAALQQFSRRPVPLSLLRPGSIKDVVYLRAMLDFAVPQVRRKTAGLRSRLLRSRQLRSEAQQAASVLRIEETRLGERRAKLAAIEARQRIVSRQASSGANRQAERALALAEQARDLDSLVSELDRADSLRERLAALSGPVPRPARPERAQTAAAAPPAPEQDDSAAPPSPYLLPVTGRTIAGFGAPEGSGVVSRGLTIAPRGGAQVVAPAAGRVAFAGPYRGYGRIVIIEHPGGWTSLVTGLARSDVAVGEQLVGGAPLGVAAEARPQVTLELRRGGEPVNPLPHVG